MSRGERAKHKLAHRNVTTRVVCDHAVAGRGRAGTWNQCTIENSNSLRQLERRRPKDRSGTNATIPRFYPKVGKEFGAMDLKNSVREELREVAWLASVVFGLSTIGVGLAVGLALALLGRAGVFGV
jgi:hypothetical protein